MKKSGARNFSVYNMSSSRAINSDEKGKQNFANRRINKGTP